MNCDTWPRTLKADKVTGFVAVATAERIIIGLTRGSTPIRHLYSRCVRRRNGSIIVGADSRARDDELCRTSGLESKLGAEA